MATAPSGSHHGAHHILSAATPDPGVLSLGGSELLVASTGGFSGGAFPLHRSSDGGRRWRYIGFAMRSPATWWAPRGPADDLRAMPGAPTSPEHAPGRPERWTERTFWAPEVHRVAERFLLYYSARIRDPWNGTHCIGVATASGPDGPYTDVGSPLLCHQGAAPLGAIDAHLFRDAANGGALHLLWKDDANARGLPTAIYSQRLRGDGLALLGRKRALFANDAATWEGPLVEAPWVVHDRSSEPPFYFLFYAGNGFGGPKYAIGVARSRSLAGPWLKARRPILHSNSSAARRGAFAGPGHCSVVPLPGVDPAAGRALLFYHAWLRTCSRTMRGCGPLRKSVGRQLFRDVISFGSGADRWPRIEPQANGKAKRKREGKRKRRKKKTRT
jgi:beta-xylosidase